MALPICSSSSFVEERKTTLCYPKLFSTARAVSWSYFPKCCPRLTWFLWERAPRTTQKQTKMFSHQDGKKTLLLLSANKANGALLLLSNIETSPQFQRDLKCGICYWINTSKSGRDNYCGFASRWRQLHCGKDYHSRFSSCQENRFEMAKWVNVFTNYHTCATLISTGFVRNILLELGL